MRNEGARPRHDDGELRRALLIAHEAGATTSPYAGHNGGRSPDEVNKAHQVLRDHRNRTEPSIRDETGRQHFLNPDGSLPAGSQASFAARKALARHHIGASVGSAGGDHAQRLAEAMALANGPAARGRYASGGGVAQAPAGPNPALLQHALAMAHAAYRDAFAFGGTPRFGTGALGVGLPGSVPLVAAPSARATLPGGGVPVLPLNLAHGYVRHGAKMRARYDDGGSPGGGDNSGNDNGGADDAGVGGGVSASDGMGLGGVGYGGPAMGVGLGGLAGIGPGASVGGYAIGQTGGLVGQVAHGSTDGSTAGSDGGFSAMSVGNAPSSTMANAAASVASMGATSSGYGYNGGTPTGVGSIGPAGIANAGGIGDVAGFGNFSGTGAADETGGLNTFSGQGYANDPASAITSAIGYHGFAGFDGGVGDAPMGAISSNLSAGPYGGLDLGSFGPTATATASPYGGLDLGSFTGAQTATANPPGYGTFGTAPTAAAPTAAPASYSALGPGLPAGSMLAAAGLGGLGVLGAPTNAASATSSAPAQAAGPAQAQAPQGFGAFGTLGSFDAAAASQPATALGFKANPTGTNLGLGSLAGSAPAGAPATGTTTASDQPSSDVTGDPTSVDDAPALTIHAPPAFAPGYQTGDDPPAELGTLDAVRNFGLIDLARNFGVDYGAQYGLSSNFSFADPAAVASVVNAAQNQESSMNPAAVNPSSLAVGLAQMLGTGTWSRNNVGPYNGAASDPAADRESAMLGAIAAPAGVDPASLDPRAVGIPAAQAALSSLPGAYTNQEAFGLAQLASNPMYAGALAAVQNPNRTVVGQEAAYTNSFENPGLAEANMISRENVAEGLYGLSKQQIAGLGGIASPSVSYGNTQPATAVTSFDAAQGLDPATLAGLASLQANPMATMPGVDAYNSALAAAPIGQPSLMAAMNAAYAAHLGDPGGIEGTGFTGDGYSTPSTPSSYNTATVDPGLTMGLIGDVANNPYGAGSLDSTEAMQARQAAALSAYAGMPSMVGLDAAGIPSDGVTPTSPMSYTAGFTADPTTLTVAKPADAAVSSTPSYMPGQAAVVKGAVNAAVGLVPGLGLVNGLSALLGGPNVGSYIASHSAPGSVSPLGGQGGNGTGNAGGLAAGSRQVAGTTSSVAPPSYVNTSTPATAQAAYLAALQHASKPGPAARKANPVALIAPTPSPITPIYNPMNDPGVQAALAAANSYR